RPLPGSTGRLVTALASSGPQLAVGRAGGGIELWAHGRPDRRLSGLATNVQALAFAASKPLLAAAGVRTLATWNPATGVLDHVSPLPGAATAVAVAPDGSRVAVGLTDGRVLVTTADGETTATLRPHGAPNVSLAFLPDG